MAGHVGRAAIAFPSYTFDGAPLLVGGDRKALG